MRHPLLQRLVALLLLAGVGLTALPFGRDVAMHERWADWVQDVAAEGQHDALWTALSALLPSKSSTRALAQALVGLDGADPAWFGLDTFSPDEVRRLEQHMAAVPTPDPYQAMWVQGQAPPASAFGSFLSALAAGEAVATAIRVAGRAAFDPLVEHGFARLLRSLVSPRAP